MLDIVVGTGGATVGLQRLGPDSVTWLPVGTAGATSSSASVYLGLGTYRGVVTGGTTPAAIYVLLQGIV